ncbi:MAG: hypothetical protein IT546_15750 [Caulobacteraceae bacterium]|nr:hypothetical protein [Caulobacteraceae bacterium]
MRPAALALGSILAAVAAPALACSCLPPASAAAQLEAADVMFKGVPISSSSNRRGEAVTKFRVQEVLKGRPAREITVRHRLDSAACGMRFARGAPALVIANAGEGGALRASLCTAARFPEAEYRRAAHGRPPAARCDANAARFAVGQRYTPALGARAQRAASADQLRVREPGRGYTRDYRIGRLNIDLNRNGRVRDVACG